MAKTRLVVDGRVKALVETGKAEKLARNALIADRVLEEYRRVAGAREALRAGHGMSRSERLGQARRATEPRAQRRAYRVDMTLSSAATKS